MRQLSFCPLCEDEKLKREHDCIDFSTSKESFSIVSCETCGFLLTNPVPKKNEINKYYLSENYISHSNSNKGLFNFLYQTIRKYTTYKKTKIINKLVKKGSVLDIGCGTGEFLNSCRKFGYKITGIEPSSTAREKALKNHKINISNKTNLSQFKKGEFDCITMWHSLEHVYELQNTLKEIQRILSDDGILIIAVPNHKSWDASYYKEFWAAWDVPIHLWHFSKKTIMNLLNNYGFKLANSRPMLFDSYYVSILSEEYKNGKKNFLKGFLIGTISNIAGATTNRGYSSEIYIFKKLKKAF